MLSLDRGRKSIRSPDLDSYNMRRYSFLQSQASIQSRPVSPASGALAGHEPADSTAAKLDDDGAHSASGESGAGSYMMPAPLEPSERRRVLKGSPSLLAVPDSPKNTSKMMASLLGKGGTTPRFGSGRTIRYTSRMKRRDSTRAKPKGAVKSGTQSQQTVQQHL